jgi:hypothetical protein
MDLDTIGKVLLILFMIPIIILLWSCAFWFLDDCFCDGCILRKIKQWASRKLEDE